MTLSTFMAQAGWQGWVWRGGGGGAWVVVGRVRGNNAYSSICLDSARRLADANCDAATAALLLHHYNMFYVSCLAVSECVWSVCVCV